MEKKAIENLVRRGFAAALLASLALVVALGAARAQDKAARLKAVAKIDSECRSVPAEFAVPAGKTAWKFSAGELTPGQACHAEGAPENTGYAIRDQKGKNVYMYSKYKDNKPYEMGGPLSSVELTAGVYTLSVAGGAGASIELEYELK